MGGSSSKENYAKKRKEISVISLNYSGILLSPFQFFSHQTPKMSNIQTNLSKIYKELLKKLHPQSFNEDKKLNKFKWNLGKIDQKMQQQRYSPLYNKTVGIDSGKIQTEQIFHSKWLEIFQKNIAMIKQKDSTFKYNQEQKNETFKFDLLCFRCILSYVYNKQFKDLSFKTVSELNPHLYQDFMNFMFDKTFLNEEKKLQKTLLAMEREKIDIVFTQEANEFLIKRLESMKDFIVYKREGCDSLIIIKKHKFHNFYNSIGKNPLVYLPELEKDLFWNNDTIIVFIDNLILISGHLSSKKQKNPTQVYEMIQSLKKLHAIYPMCHIIVGVDANSFVPDSYSSFCKENADKLGLVLMGALTIDHAGPVIEIYPSLKESFTTSKQRTYLQPQINKAEQVAQVCRDHLIILKAEDIEIEQTKVCTINNKSPAEVRNLPCEEHPYDHYVIKGIITVNVMTHFGKNYDDGK